ncbi:MAG TPA: DUF192 domain-containing protein [Rhodocyclaceae bacterium]|nr:DUF192 domain-containing protein [Rhodocyclaceae bacterium]HMV53385.1 DUF192 domain-containing protein [Rhodocyclaceae bacterium]HNA03554.1 DUF192 domain-containing protein [Rhodocyclaceae bacterium]HNB77638.1 DUF192 domain-containing protein [Rhodocyclaceae bacterium]HNC61445.1 DUF192 domain-containing protein [Rhodocyclaceae bacterium]
MTPARFFHCTLVTTVALLYPLAACAQPAMPTVELSIGLHRIEAERADSFATRAQGLMHRRQMAANHGMLFVFDRAERHCMWMRNTLIPLSVAFIDESGAILNIEDMAPQTEDTHCAAAPARYALEMNAGWFAQRKLVPGARVSGIELRNPATHAR